jgi:threonine synthase
MSTGAEGHVSRLVCSGCGFSPPAVGPYPFHCPAARAGDDIDHVLARELDAPRVSFRDDADPQPFIRYRGLLHVWHDARARALGDEEYVALVRELDARLSRVAGRGLRVTSFGEQPALAGGLPCDLAALLVKDETAGVAGSHKARHLFGTWLHLEAAAMSGSGGGARTDAPLAIASCGNAALAAATLARAAGRRLRVYLPAWASPEVMSKLEGLGAELKVCPRVDGAAGDPSYLSFRAALDGGEVPFSCQGPDNSLALDGGRTLAYEIISALAAEGRRLDRVFLQVGGGALASSFIQAFDETLAVALLPGPPPRFHAVQPAGSAPLARAYDRLAARILSRNFGGDRAGGDRARTARLLSTEAAPEVIEDELRRAARERSRYMWPWEGGGQSAATGILDDETYDWWAVVRGMIKSGGFPVVLEEETLLRAHALARRHTDVSATGAAGLAGAFQLSLADASAMSGETVAVIFTG